MKKILKNTLSITIFLAAVFVNDAGAEVFCNEYGRCTGMSSDGQAVSTVTSQYGHTTGYIGDKSVSTNTSRYGHTTGYVGDEPVSLNTSGYGRTTGYIGNRSVSCSTSSFSGRTTCY